MRFKLYPFFILLTCFLTSWGCTDKSKTGELRFTKIDASHSGIDFNNEIIEDDSLNFYHNEYVYIGSGVGVGDFNKDGLQDVFFGGSQVESKLYINKGNFEFEDVTLAAGITNTEWITGVTVEDVNQDGWDDIYLCVSHFSNPNQRKNLLFINQGTAELKFVESAEAYGLADTGFSTNAAFFDYDKDGDLDMYLLNHKLFDPQPNRIVRIDTSGLASSSDKLFRNEGGAEHPIFKNVSLEAGIREDGYGLGIVISDINQDNFPDIYVANDYLSNDYLWINNGKGGFENQISAATRHQSFSSMGVDIADINNDLLPDIGVLDMMPNTNERKKMMTLGFSPDKYDMQRRAGYHHQYSRNVLQVNQGSPTGNIPVFSEIGQLANISETDWSWSILFADFDNDRWKDIHVSNGLGKDLTNSDFISFTSEELSKQSFFGGSFENSVSQEEVVNWTKELDKFGSVSKENFLFVNDKNLNFLDKSEILGNGEKSVSQGAAYADFDNDGDLDLVVNNMNQKAFIYRNELRGSVQDSTNNFLKVNLEGLKGNLNGVGSKIVVFSGDDTQIFEETSTRGYASSVDKRIHVGLGELQMVDSLKVLWSSGKVSVLKAIKANQELFIKESEAVSVGFEPLLKKATPIFQAMVSEQFQAHQEKIFSDFSRRRMQPQKYSQLGPAMAKADVNGDGLGDIFIGGSKGQESTIYIQNSKGEFTKSSLSGSQKNEDLDAVFLDIDKDGDQDLITVGGSTELPTSGQQSVLVYLNDGKGNFDISENHFPRDFKIFSSTITAKDIDNDGDEDLFIGGRLDNTIFPGSPESFLFENVDGKFKDVTPADLSRIGMVTDAVCLDFDEDGLQDLVICGDYMELEFFKNTNDGFKRFTQETELTGNHGWWRSLKLADIDQDGDLDIVAGNFGENSKYHVTAENPAYLFAKDLDNNGTQELMPAYFIKNLKGEFKLFPDLSRDQFAEQTPKIRQYYAKYAAYSNASMSDVIDHFGRNEMLELRCDYLGTAWFENLGSGKFTRHELPKEAQFAPVNAIEVADLNSDGFPDLILAGNEYHTEVSTGRSDASYGTVLLNENGKGWSAVPSYLSGLYLIGDVRSMLLLNNGKNLLFGVNNALPAYFSLSANK
ncbi:VCBS repeat-containing protein [Arcticibacterium luteifluviistationis]|uniref:RNA-binding protein n=1 Tax=Arcticibacterium luteifluviistationis TaxID=1784714 RepID=A0A2Z4GB79_9BACT|nr:VCBS repeat-containing protein [Arcticibacterium luteifluviistationis]AWV98381.1 RNA-binding protein [Arcticibacterium luteifluviistationis]